VSVLKNIGAFCFHRVGARCPVHANNCLRIFCILLSTKRYGLVLPTIQGTRQTRVQILLFFFSRKKHGSVKSCTVPFPSQVGSSRAFLALDTGGIKLWPKGSLDHGRVREGLSCGPKGPLTMGGYGRDQAVAQRVP